MPSHKQKKIDVLILVKVKLTLCLAKYHTMKTYGVDIQFLSFLNSVLDVGE